MIRGCALALFCLLLGACSEKQPKIGSGAEQVAAIGRVPPQLTLAAGEMLRRCALSTDGRAVFHRWEARPTEKPYSLVLTERQLHDDGMISCLAKEAKSLGVDDEMDFAEEPSQPPS